MRYEIELEPRAFRQLKHLQRQDQRRVSDRIERLREDPRPGGCEKLSGMRDAFRVRQGDYRIVYTIDDSIRVVTITRIGHRREVYRRR